MKAAFYAVAYFCPDRFVDRHLGTMRAMRLDSKSLRYKKTEKQKIAKEAPPKPQKVTAQKFPTSRHPISFNHRLVQTSKTEPKI